MIHFILNNTYVQTEVSNGMSLLRFIREEQGLKGTKSGCKEGDCGACTVLLGSLKDDGKVRYKSITSCLTPLASVAGKHVVSIEGLNIDKELNQAQKAIKENFATQCGFCTPGFVTALSGLALQAKPVDIEDATNAISGNICRCTGYKSIEKAAEDIVNSLLDKDFSNTIEWLIQKQFIPQYFRDIPEKLKSIIVAPTDNQGVLVGGGTDLYVRHADKLNHSNIQISHNFISKTIEIKDSVCTLGGSVQVSQLMENTDLNVFFPRLKSYLKLVSSEQIRNTATITGNFVNASPIGDLSIFFLALNANLKIQKSDKSTRHTSLKAFFLDYKKVDLQDDEYIAAIDFDLPDSQSHFNFEKVSKRTHLDIAGVNTAIHIKVNNQIIYDMNLSMGGVAAIPLFCRKTTRFLQGKELNSANLIEAQKILQQEIAPISDVRGSENYKRLLAKQLFFAHFIELFPERFQLKDLV